MVIKLKDSTPPKVRARGMHLGMHMIEARPKVFAIDKKQDAALLESKQFGHYMEIVKVKNLKDLEVGDYTDGKVTTKESKAALAPDSVVEPEAEVEPEVEPEDNEGDAE